MRVANSKNLGEIIQGNRREAVLRSCTLDVHEMIRRHHTSTARFAYYIDRGRNGRRLFGVKGGSQIFFVPEDVYRTLGSPSGEVKISLYKILAVYETHRANDQ